MTAAAFTAIAIDANRRADAWKAYAEHRENCRECWIGIRDNAPPDRGLCQKGAQLRGAAVAS